MNVYILHKVLLPKSLCYYALSANILHLSYCVLLYVLLKSLLVTFNMIFLLFYGINILRSNS